MLTICSLTSTPLLGQAISAVETISQTIETLQAWMSSNCLRLNPTKTQLIWFGTRQQLAKIDIGSLAIKYPHFTFSSSVHDLGVTLDQERTFVQHINLLCRSCYYQLRQIRVVSRSLFSAAASTLIHCFVVSRLDYCSAICERLSTCRCKCLDRVLRKAAAFWAAFQGLAGSLRVYAGCSSLALQLTAHCLSCLCVGSALHIASSTLAEGALLSPCGYSAPCLIALFCEVELLAPPHADCYLTA